MNRSRTEAEIAERMNKQTKKVKKSIINTNILEHISPFGIHYECNLMETYSKSYSNQNHRENVIFEVPVVQFECQMLGFLVFDFGYVLRMHVEYIPFA